MWKVILHFCKNMPFWEGRSGHWTINYTDDQCFIIMFSLSFAKFSSTFIKYYRFRPRHQGSQYTNELEREEYTKTISGLKLKLNNLKPTRYLCKAFLKGKRFFSCTINQVNKYLTTWTCDYASSLKLLRVRREGIKNNLKPSHVSILKT